MWYASLVCAIAVAAFAQPPRGGPRLATFRSTADGTEQEYAVYTPRSYDPARRYPLILALHEEDSNHIAELKHIFGLPARYGETTLQVLTTLPVLPDIEFVIACPTARGNMGYQGVAEQDVYDTLADVQRHYSVDPDRVYLTGASMGGGGALWMALTRPDVWAAVAPLCAAVIPGSGPLAGNALHLPIRLFHGEQDPLVPVESSRQWQKRLLELGVPVDYVEYPGARHNAWDFAYRGTALMDWFAARRRVRDPGRVRFTTESYRYPGAYWVRVDGLTPGIPATVEAARDGAAIKVTTRNLDAFTLSTAARTVEVDGETVRLRAGAPLSFVKTGARWTQGVRAAGGKRAGLEGPIVDAFRARSIWVYGTADHPGERETARRRAMVESGAVWNSLRARVNLHAEIRADRDVTDGEIAGANLVLFGNRGTNTLIARFAANLPMELNPGAADYGMTFIAPVNGRYVVVSAGLPWWTGADDANRGGYRFAPAQYRLLSTFGDYILFRGGIANVLAEGRFDRDWKLPAGDAVRLRATGVVTLP
ncbi:MAG: dienelactone hydrolase family protein [Acidobacteria bacterium]|nr:dienelactone hydrolase family protein [Acidobacteriota bacterium]